MARWGRRATRGVLLLGAAGGVTAWATRRRSTPASEPGPLPGRPRLVEVLGGTLPHGQPPQPRERVLQQGRQVVGRDRSADVRIADPTVSPRHALVEADREGRVVVRDLGALNGLQVDGIPVVETELHDGNRLQLGNTQLVYRVDPFEDRGGRSGGELGENIAREPERSRLPDGG